MKGQTMKDYYAQFENCRQKEEPDCAAACPFHFDVLDFHHKIQGHKYDRAYKTYSTAVLFPQIVSSLCPEYCSNVCPRKDFDGAVQLKLLEKTCVARANKREPAKYNLPERQGTIGIVGAGISGLACAVKLLEKKYHVVIFEKTHAIGGQLKKLLPEPLYMEDIMRHLEKENYQLNTNCEIKSLHDLDCYHFHCIYIATGKGGKNFGLSETDGTFCCTKNNTAILGGGALAGKDVICSIADGMEAAAAMDCFFQTGSLSYHTKNRSTGVIPDVSKFAKPMKPVLPGNGEIFTEEETQQEAERCIRCQCDACWFQCDMVGFHKKWPIAVREDIVTTVTSAQSMIHKAPAIRLLNTCTQCGAFKDACPAHIELCDMILKGRKLLHRQNKMPPAFHGFWLDDMKHACSSLSKICRNAPGKNISEYAFFPGCNLGAADPRYVNLVYSWLLENFENMGLLLRCCGIHALWSGREDFMEEQIESLKTDWIQLGRPKLVCTCPTCMEYIQKALPEIEVTSLYQLMEAAEKWPENPVSQDLQEEPFSIFDPCAAAYNEQMKESVRALLRKKEIKFDALWQDSARGCCGYGGDTDIANPEFTKYVASRRVSASENPYITYCINCRDVFIDEKKPAVHILDLLFPVNSFKAENPGYTQRRRNREALKKQMLKQIWNEEMQDNKKTYDFDVIFDQAMKDKLQSLRLVEEDIKQVIEQSNTAQRRVYDKGKNEYICYSKLNYITCWVRYSIPGDSHSYIIKNIYIHRMNIELEAIWNGRKINTNV